MRVAAVIVVVWLLIGLLAAFQRGYLGDNASCAKVGTIGVTVVAGPLNYVGLNPKIKDCKVPQPSR